MEIIQKEPIFSKPGKASRHAHSNHVSSPRKRAKPKTAQPTPITNVKSLIQQLQKQQQADLQAQKAKIKLSPSFKAVSRQQYQFAFRNKTGSPKVGNYSPNDQITSPRTTKGPKMIPHTSIPKQKRVLLAKCVDHSLDCSFPRKSPEKPAKFNQRLNRTIHTAAQYDQQARLKQIKWSPVPQKQPARLISPMKFNLQKNRHPFIKSTDAPNQKRFDFVFPTSFVLSNNKKPTTTDVEKVSKRGELFPLGMSLGWYDRNQEATLPKLSRLVPNFQKEPGRRGLSLDHIVKNPVSPDLTKLDHAVNLQSIVRGPVKIPLMAQQSARDDIMYRTIEMYTLNVPERQDSMSPPKYMGDSLQDFVSKARMTATLSSFANKTKQVQ